MPTRAASWPGGTRIVWRSLTWGEYREVQSHFGPLAEKALLVYKKCVIDGPAPEVIPAGIMMWLGNFELQQTPFSGTFPSISAPLEQARQKVAGTFLLSAQALIASVLRVPFTDMEKWDGDTFLTRLAQAEFIAGAPLNPVDPNAPVSTKGSQKQKTPKKPMTPIQQKALDRKNERDQPNASGPRSVKPSLKR